MRQFNNSQIKDYAQGRLYIIGRSEEEVRGYDGLDLSLTIQDKSDGELYYRGEAIRLSEVLIEVGMVKSRSEFRRRLKQGSFWYRAGLGKAEVLQSEPDIDLRHEMFYEIRSGQRVLEFIVVGEGLT